MCNTIIHGRCFQHSEFIHVDDQSYCPDCAKSCTVKETKYNPFPETVSKSESDKFYDGEPVDYDPLIDKKAGKLKGTGVALLTLTLS